MTSPLQCSSLYLLFLFFVAVTSGFIFPVTQFDKATTLEHLFYSELTNCAEGKVTNWSCSWCKAPAHPVVSPAFLNNAPQQTHAYVGRLDGTTTITIAFRGSRDRENWIDDLDFKKTTPAFVKAPVEALVHAGFQYAYLSLRSQMFSALSRLLREPPCVNQLCSVLVVGHSLGGAMATLAAADVTLDASFSTPPLRLKLPLTLTTFGSPRVGNEVFAKWLMAVIGPRSTRVVHQNDLVPGLPPRNFGFHHIPTEVWERRSVVLNASDTYTICTASEEDPVCGKRVADSIMDHLYYMDSPIGLCS